MKLSRVIVVVVMASVAAACGSSTSSDDSGSGGTGTAANLSSSMNSMTTILSDSEVAACITGTTQSANCPGGGTVSWSGAELVVNDCQASDGKTFAGTITSADGLTIDGTFSTFGECTDVTGQDLPVGTCGGNLTGTCSGTSNLTCTLVDDGTGTACTCN